MLSLDDRKAETLSRLDELRQARGAAYLEGRKFDHADIEAAERELEAITAAEGEVARREREAHGKAVEARKREMWATVARTEERRLKALDDAQKAAKSMASAVAQALACGVEITDLIHQFDPSLKLSLRDDFKDRLSRHLGSELRSAIDMNRAFGSITFPERQDCFAGSWREAEEKIQHPSLKGK
jgi:hypothetical protein